jgi:geranylgeranyl pyrophosphate synthase
VSLESDLAGLRERVEATLAALLPPASGPDRSLAEAMRYAVLGGGKRLRPLLVLASCSACGGRIEDALFPAAALELIHAYSLAHDDLPAMDDDDLRRGRPTLHRAFGEAAAILAGDALLTLAFEVLAREPAGDARAQARAEAVVVVAERAGRAGMVGGQQADLEAEGGGADLARVEWIHCRKTGALLSACAEVGAIHACAPAPRRAALARYGMELGLAFQIADDVLDVTSTAQTLGKTPGKDDRARKATYPAQLGLEESRAHAALRIEQALAALHAVELHDDRLEHLARFALERSR